MTEIFAGEFIQNLIVIPAAVLCYLPMLDQLRESPAKIILKATPIFLGLSLAESYAAIRLRLDGSIELAPMLICALLFYLWSVNWQKAKAIAIFIDVMSLMSVMANLSAMYDASRHSELGINSSTMDYSVFLLLSGTIVTVLAAPFFYKYGRKLTSRFHISKVWYLTLPFSGCILVLNIYARPMKYETYYVNRVGSITLTFLIVGLGIWLVMNVVFYMIVIEMLNAAEAEQELNILRLEEDQYRAQQSYIRESARARHDFRQTVAALKLMADEGKTDSIRKYLSDYIKELPENEMTQYSSNHALNAILNFYVSKAGSAGIEIRINADAEDQDALSDAEMCTIIGNLLENAISACSAADASDRFIQLDMTVRGDWLYIVETNGFDGKVKMIDGNYVSTKAGGGGYGLASVRETARRHGGRAMFSHAGREFHVDVAVPFMTD